MRVLALLLVALGTLASASAAGWGRNNNQSVVFGYKAPYDRVLFYDRAILSPRRGQSVVYNMYYPSAAFKSYGEKITSIQIMDRWLNGTNGNVFFNGGGVGQSFINLSIRSALNYGLNYEISVYGRK